MRKPCFAILLSLSAAGCVQTGDFGRPRASFWNDVVVPETGALAAHLSNEPVSRYPLTDDENELRDRAWRFLMPVKERVWFEAAIADLVRTRVLPVDLYPADRTAYHHALMSESFRSPASRYRQLSEDAFVDLKLIGRSPRGRRGSWPPIASASAAFPTCATWTRSRSIMPSRAWPRIAA